MPIVRWPGFRPVPVIADEMERLYQMMRHTLPTAATELVSFGPAVDVYETEAEVVVKAELPGVKKEEVQVTAERDAITLRGETKRAEEVKEEGYHRKEIREGKFYRAIALPAPIQPDKVTAKFDNGILTITAPRAEEAKGGTAVAIE
jgi:HSP20 family protein